MATIRKLRGRWQAQVRRKGFPPKAKSFDNRADAERWARALEAVADHSGVLPDTRSAESTTLAEILRRYRDEVSPKKRSAANERTRIAAMMKRPICHRTLALLTSSDLASYRDQRLQEVAPATVIRELNTIAHAIDVARGEWGVHLAQNPARLVRRPSPPKGRMRRLLEGEEGRLLAAADAGRSPYMRNLIVLAVETGMRRGEILGLRWEHVDRDRRVVHLPLTKNGDSRNVPLSSRAMAAIEAQAGVDPELVFPVSGGAARQAWEHLVRRAGVVGLTFHDLRHEAVSRLFERGLNVIEVGAISGHKELKMLGRYAHLRAEDLVVRLG